MPVNIDQLRQIPLFASLGDDDLKHIAVVTKQRTFRRGDIILLEGERGGNLCYIDHGLVKIFKTSSDGKEQIIRLIESGQTFNEVPAIDGEPNPASAAAMQDSTIYLVSGEALRSFILESPAVAAAVVSSLTSALRRLVSLVEDLSFRQVTARVAKILYEQEHQHKLTQQEIAAMAGTAREVVGRALKQLEMHGAIEIRQGHVTVKNVDLLHGLALG
jgi:CRP-like cAMP-binding protein